MTELDKNINYIERITPEVINSTTEWGFLRVYMWEIGDGRGITLHLRRI